MEPVARTEFDARELAELDRAIRTAETASRFEFSVFRGLTTGDPAAFARQLHAHLVAPARSVLILVDPAKRAIEVVTGAEAARRLTDSEVELAVLEMQSAFAEGDDLGGLKRGLALLAEHAR